MIFQKTEFLAKNLFETSSKLFRVTTFLTGVLLLFVVRETQAQQTTASPCRTAGLGIPATYGGPQSQFSRCEPASHSISYRLAYYSQPPTGHNYAIVFEWGDGVRTEVSVNPSDVGTSTSPHEVTRRHTYPDTAALCVYTARVKLHIDDQECQETLKEYSVTSWSTDDKRGGEIKISAPNLRASDNLAVKICEGEDINIQFQDQTTLNCQGGTRPNDEKRTYQVVYRGGASAIPNVSVGSVKVTDSLGNAIVSGEYSPEGVVDVATPVTATYQHATIHQIKAPGGFGSGFPKSGDEFQVELRYWNVCNPYSSATGAANALTATATIQIVKAPDPPTLSDTLFCVGNSSNTYNVQASSSSVTNPSYKWYDETGRLRSLGPSRFYPLYYFNISRFTGGEAKLSVVVNGSATGASLSCESEPTTTTFAIRPALVAGKIYAGSKSSATSHSICSGEDVKAFTTTSATGGDGTYAYSWESSSNNVTYSTTGDTSQGFDPDTLTADTWYRRKVTSTPNAVGTSTACKAAYSNTFKIAVQKPVTPGAIGQNQLICLGGSPPEKIKNVTTPTEGDGNYLYQWESTTTDPTSSAFTQANVTVETNSDTTEFEPPAKLATTTWYRRAVRSGVCSKKSPGSWARTPWTKIEVNSTLQAGSIAFETSSGARTDTSKICSGGKPLTLKRTSAPSGGTTYTFQWKVSDSPGGTYTLIQGATDSAEYAPPSLTRTQYYVQTITSGICSINSNEIQALVTKRPSVSISGGGSICGSSSPAPDVVITVKGGVAPWKLSYRRPGSSTALNEDLGSAGDTTSTFTISSPPVGTYSVVSVVDAAACSAPSLTEVAKVANATAGLATISSLTADSSVCAAGTNTDPPNAIITFSPSGAANYRVKYTVGGKSQPTYTGTSLADGRLLLNVGYALWGNNPGTRKLVITEAVSVASGCKIALPTDSSVDLKVDSVPSIPPNQAKTICSGLPANYTITMTGAPANKTKFSWTKNGISSTKNATDSLHITDTLTNFTNIPREERYEVTPSRGSCSGASATVRIYVNSEPVIQAGQSTSICGGSRLNYAVKMTNTPLNTRITWINPRTNVSSSFPLQQTPIINDALKNTSKSKEKQVVYYSLSAKSNFNCISKADSLTVTILPVPEFGTNPEKDICPDQPANYSIVLAPAGKPSGVNFSWNDPTSGDPITVPAGASSKLHITDEYSISGTKNYVVTAISADSCESASKTITIAVNAPPVKANITKYVCESILAGQNTGSGKGSIDLTSLEQQVGKKASDSVEWYTDYNQTNQALSGRIDLGTNAGESQNYQINSDQTVYAEIFKTTGAGCSSIAEVKLIYQPIPPTSSIIYSGSGVRDSNGYNICMDSTLTHTFQVPQSPSQTGHSKNATYKWVFPGTQAELAPGGDVTSSSLVLVFPVKTPAKNGIVTVTEYHNGCPGVTQKDTVNTESTASKSRITGPGVVCTGNTNQKYSVVGAGQSSALYTWALPAGVSFVTNTSTRRSEIFVDFTGDALLKRKDTLKISVKVQTGLAKCVAEAADPLNVVRVQTPSMTSASQATICSGNLASSGVQLAATGGPATVNYNWKISAIQGTIGNAVVGTKQDIADSLGSTQPLTNQSGVSGSVTYNVSPVGPNLANGGNSCLGSGQSVTITVNPEPVIIAGQNKKVCGGNAVNYEILLQPANLPKNTRFNWPAISTAVAAGSNVLSGDAPGTLHIKDVIENKTTNEANYTYQVTPDDGNATLNCVGKQQNVVIKVQPEPVGTNAAVKVCSNVKLNYDLQDNINRAASGTTGLPSTFTWYAENNPNVTGETLLNSTGSGFSTSSKIDDLLVNTSNSDQTVVYHVVPKNKFSQTPKTPECLGDKFLITVTVHPEPVGATKNVSICSGLPLNYNLNANIAKAKPQGVHTGIIYTWTTSNNPNITTLSGAATPGSLTDTLSNITISSQAITYTVTPTYTATGGVSCKGKSFTINTVVHPEPRGAAHTKTICSRGAADVNLQSVINSKGNKLTSTFTWSGAVTTTCQSSNCGIQGLTTAPAQKLIISDVLTNKSSSSVNVDYTVTPSSQSQSCVGSPFTVTVTINPEPVGATLPDDTVCSSVNFSYDLQAKNLNTTNGNSVPSTFTWRATSNPSVTGEPTTTQASDRISVTLENKTFTRSKVAFTVTPVSKKGLCTGSPFMVNLQVNPEPVGFDDQFTICGGLPLNYNLQTNNVDKIGNGGNALATDFSWVAAQNTNVQGESTTNQTTSTVADTITNVTTTAQSVTYTITPTSQKGSCRGKDFQLLVTVNQTPQASSTTHTICSGSSFSRNLVGNITNNAPSTFVWSAANNLDVRGEITATQVVSNVNNTLINTSGVDQKIVYTVTPTTTSQCQGTDFTLQVTIHPEPVGTPDTVSLCSGTPLAYALQANIDKKGNVPSSFRWKSSTSVVDLQGESTVEQTTGSIRDNLANVTAATQQVLYEVTPMSSGDNCEGSDFTILVTVYPEPTANDATGLNLCSGDSFNFDLRKHQRQTGNALTTNTSYTWLASNTANVTGESLTNQKKNTIDDALLLNTNVITSQRVSYTVTPVDLTNNCSGSSFSVQVSVKPKPVGADESALLCNNSLLNFRLPDNIVNRGNRFTNNTTYTWSTIDNVNLTGETTTPTNGNLIDDRLTNTTNTPQSIVYQYIPENSNGCTGDTVDITFTINPSPILNPQLSKKSICSTSQGHSNQVGITLGVTTASIPAAGYNITSSLKTITGFTGTPTVGNNLAANAIFSDSYNNVTTSTVDVVYTVVPISGQGSCLGAPMDVVVKVYPEPVVNPNLNAVVCSRLPAGIVLSTNGTSVAADSYTLEGLNLPTSNPSFSVAMANATVSATGGTSLIEQDTFTNLTSADAKVRYAIRATSAQTGGAGGCIGEPQEVVLTVRPEPTLDTTPPSAVCSGLTSGIALQASATSVMATKYSIVGKNRSNTALTEGTNNSVISFLQPPSILSNDVFYNTTQTPLKMTYSIVPISAENCLGQQADLVLTINPAPAIASDLDKIVCSGQPTEIILNTEATAIRADNYDIVSVNVPALLTARAGNAGTGVDVGNNAIKSDRFDNPTNDPLRVTYKIRGKSQARCDGSEKDVVLTVEPTLKATPVVNLKNICSDSKVDIVLESPSNPSSGKVTFDYRVSTPLGTATPITGFVNAQSNLPEQFKIESTLSNTSSSVGSITYEITAVADGAQGGLGCTSPNPFSVPVSIEPRPVVNAAIPSRFVCEGIPLNVVLTSPTNPSTGNNDIEFESSLTANGGMTLTPPLTPSSVYALGASIVDRWENPTLDNQSVIYKITPRMATGLQCKGVETDFEIAIKPNPELSPVALQEVCSSQPLRIPLDFDLPTSYATWSPSTPAAIIGVATGGGTAINLTPVNTSLDPQTITYLVIPKRGECVGSSVDVMVQVNPSPDVIGLPDNTTVCNGQTLNLPLSSTVPGVTAFEWTVEDGYGLGTPGEFDGTGTTINQPLDNLLGYQVVLIYKVVPTSAFSCVGSSAFMNVEVTSIVPEIHPNKVKICSGDNVSVVNTSRGATSHKWFYRLQGTNETLDQRTEPSVSYTLTNNTDTNPIYYEIVYEARNEACSKPNIKTPPIAVYRSVTAQFDEGVVPPLRGGLSDVSFTNTSDPIEPTQFRYEWDFGVESQPDKYTGDTPPAKVTYTTRGSRDVTLKVVNNDSELDGLSCEDTFVKTILVPVAPLKADFDIDLSSVCVPLTLKINNQSTGDVSEWRILSDGALVLKSSEKSPKIDITAPGEYSVFLTTRDPFTGQNAVLNKTFTVYDKPKAQFTTFPTTVFVPDTEMKLNNLSERANIYSWDFGDNITSDEKDPPAHKYEVQGKYELTLIAGYDYGNGAVCRDTVVQLVTAKTGGQIKTPNSFTPNLAFSPTSPSPGAPGGSNPNPSNSGINDVFLPIVQGARTFNMQVYDRWGNLIFESNDAKKGWDGRNQRNARLMPAGVYVYRLEIQLSNGEVHTRIGDVTMIR